MGSRLQNLDMASFPGCKCVSPIGGSADSSMIFERNVEDTCNGLPFSRHGSTASIFSRPGGLGQPITLSTTKSGHRTSRASQQSLPYSQVSPLDSPELLQRSGSIDQRRHLENFVAPALDASCSIIADESTSFNNLDIVYMRKPSTIGLDMALGKARSNSFAVLRNEKEESPRSRSLEENPRTLRFYSYADMLSDEMATSPTSSRMPVSRSVPASSMRTMSQYEPMHFSNPFKKTTTSSGSTDVSGNINNNNNTSNRLRRDSAPATGSLNLKSTRYSASALSRSPTSQRASQSSGPPMASMRRECRRFSKPKSRSRCGSVFQIESSGSDEFSSDEEDECTFSQDNNRGNLVFFPLASGVSRTGTHASINGQTSSQRGNRASICSKRRESIQGPIGGRLMEETLQTKRVADLLRKEMGIRRKQDLTGG